MFKSHPLQTLTVTMRRPKMAPDVMEEAMLRDADVKGEALLQHWRASPKKRAPQQPRTSSPSSPGQGSPTSPQPPSTTLACTSSSFGHLSPDRSVKSGGGGQHSGLGNTHRSLGLVTSRVATSGAALPVDPPATIEISNRAAGILDTLLGPSRWRTDPLARTRCTDGDPNKRRTVAIAAGAIPKASTMVPVPCNEVRMIPLAHTSSSDASQSVSQSSMRSSQISATTTVPQSERIPGEDHITAAMIFHDTKSAPKVLSPLETVVAEHRAERNQERRDRAMVFKRRPTKGSQPRRLAPLAAQLSRMLAVTVPNTLERSIPSGPVDDDPTTTANGNPDLDPDWGTSPAVPHLRPLVHHHHQRRLAGREVTPFNASSHSRTRFQLVPGTWSVGSAPHSVADGAVAMEETVLGVGTVGVGPKAATQIETLRNRELRAAFNRTHPAPNKNGQPFAVAAPDFVSMEQHRAEALQRLSHMTEQVREERRTYRLQLEHDTQLEVATREAQRQQVLKEKQATQQRKKERRAAADAAVEARRRQEREEREREREEADARQEDKWRECAERRELVAAAREASALRQLATFGDTIRAATTARASLASKTKEATVLAEDIAKLTKMMVDRDKACSQNARAVAKEQNTVAKQRFVAQVRVETEENAGIIAARRSRGRSPSPSTGARALDDTPPHSATFVQLDA